MNKSIATEKEEIIRKVESSLIKDGWRLPVILTDLSQSLDHIASVARQEGREEAIEEAKNIMASRLYEWDKPIDEMPNDWYVHNDTVRAMIGILAKLTGKEEKV